MKINKRNQKEVNILFDYIKDRDYYSKINVFDYKAEGDTAIIVRHTQSSLSSILVLRKDLNFLNEHKYILKNNPNQLILIKERLKRDGYYIHEIVAKLSGLEDRKSDILVTKDNNIIFYYRNRKDVPYIKTYIYEPKKLK